jgi:hypothetical protein
MAAFFVATISTPGATAITGTGDESVGGTSVPHRVKPREASTRPRTQTGQAGEWLRQRIDGVPIPFIVNRSQTDPAVAFYAPTFLGTLYVTRNGEIVYSLRGPAQGDEVFDRRHQRPIGRRHRQGWTLTEIPTGRKTRPMGEERAASEVNFFIGSDRARWTTGVAAYDSVTLGEVWPGVDLALRARGRSVEKFFQVHPGAEPGRIRMRVAGAQLLGVNAAGALVATTGLGKVTFTPPVAYQEREGVRRVVTVAYRTQGHEYGFVVGGYDRALPLVIDPLLQATYLGGSSLDGATALAVHPTSGEMYVAGQANSTDFPGTAGGAQPAKNAGGDLFVARLNASLTALNQATYLGGSGADGPFVALAIHPISGDVYVAATTDSSDFPGTGGGAQAAYGGGLSDLVVARLNASLTTLTQATYIGGNGQEGPPAIAINPISGEVYVAGDTDSSNFPGTAGGAQSAFGGGLRDVFATRLNASLTGFNQSTYLGGSGTEDFFGPAALAVHPISGDVYVAGATGSADFPGTAGGAQSAPGGVFKTDFVARLNPSLTTLKQSTYLGGSSGEDEPAQLAFDPASGDVYVAGITFSTDFPGTAGGAQPAFGGGGGSGNDAFVARLNASLTTLKQATYLGGSGGDEAWSLVIHPTSGDLYVGGTTDSANFPSTACGFQPALASNETGFVARLNSALTVLKAATYLGGSGGFETVLALAIHPISGEVYAAGPTFSADFPGTAGGAQPAFGGGNGVDDGFIARLTADLAGTPPTTTVALAPSTPNGSNGWYVSNVHVTATATDAAGGSCTAETRCILDPASPPASFGDIPPGCAFTGAGADVSSDGTHVIYAASKGVAGNVETPVSVAFKIDKTPPTVTCGPTPVFLLGGMGGNVSASVTDATSGPVDASISAAVTAGDVATAGLKAKSLTGFDNAGNSTTVLCPFVLEFNFLGFLPPIPNKSSFKAGSTIAVKFRLGDANGTPILKSDAQALASACDVQIFFTGGNPSPNCASYDGNAFHFNLDTAKGLAPGTYAITVKVFVGGNLVNTESVDIAID